MSNTNGFRTLLVKFCLVSLFNIFANGIDLHNLPAREESEEIAIRKWKEMEKGMKDNMANLVKQAMPYLESASIGVQLGDKCTSDIFKLALGVTKFELWALKFLDAIGKPEGGQLTGSSGAFGDYQECLDNVVPSSKRSKKPQTQGKYCRLEISPPIPPKPKMLFYKKDVFTSPNATFELDLMKEMKKMAFAFYSSGFQIGICIPSSCTRAEIEAVLIEVLKSTRLNVKLHKCEIKKPFSMDQTQLIIASLIVIFASISVLSTLADWCICWNRSQNIDQKPKSPGIGSKLVEAFSISRNLIKTIKVSEKDGILECLNGIRSISMTWVILGHTYIQFDPRLLRNLNKVDAIQKDFLFQAIANAYSSVQTFFILTAVLISYNVVKFYDEHKHFNFLLQIVRRIWRLLPSIILTIGMVILLPLASSGPLWEEAVTQQLASKCRTNFWPALTFINNYFFLSEMCIPHTWYVSIDFQMFLLSIVYFLILFRYPILSKFILGSMIMIATVGTAIQVYTKGYTPAILTTVMDAEFGMEVVSNFYVVTYVQFSNNAIGLALGTYLARLNCKIQISKIKLIFGWLLATISAMSVLYGIYPWNAGRYPQPLESTIYAVLSRPVWGLSISWVIFVCATGNGGLVNQLLSWNGFQPSVRISYLMYLLHFPIIMAFGASRQGLVDADHTTFVWCFFGNLCITVIASFFTRIIFEAPFGELDRLFVTSLMNSEGKDKKMSNEVALGRPEEEDSSKL